MKITIRSKNIELNQTLEDYINEKIQGLEKFLKILQNQDAEARVEVERTTIHHKKGLVFRAECQLDFPGESIRAEAVSEDLKLAINEVKDKLQRELKEYKEKKLHGNSF